MRGWIAPLIIAATTCAVWAAGPPIQVAPGGVIRWPGDGSVSACLASGERFLPDDGTCLYPIDLLTPAGGYEVGRVRNGAMETVTVTVGAYPYEVEHLTVAQHHVTPSSTESDRAAREARRVGQLWSSRRPARPHLPLAPPLQPMPPGRNFGTRRVFNDVPRSPHSGIDFAAQPGTAVHATADGLVVLAAEHFYAGNSVFVDHGDGLVSMYFHLAHITVKEGQEVARGDVIGAVGATGRVTGPHLHFGLRWRGSRIDPSALLETLDALPTVVSQQAPDGG